MTTATLTRPTARLSKADAEALTHRIRSSASALWLLVCEAHDRKAWQALGYPTWRAYVTAELHMSESRSYQLVDAGHVVRAAQQALGDASNVLELAPTAREAQRAKGHLTLLRRELKAQVAAGLEPPVALKAAIRALPAPDRPSPAPKPPAPRVRVPRGMRLCEACGGLGYR